MDKHLTHYNRKILADCARFLLPSLTAPITLAALLINNDRKAARNPKFHPIV